MGNNKCEKQCVVQYRVVKTDTKAETEEAVVCTFDVSFALKEVDRHRHETRNDENVSVSLESVVVKNPTTCENKEDEVE